MFLVGDFIPKNLNVRLPDELKDRLVLANLEGPICTDVLPRSNKVGVCLHSNVEKLRSWGVERFAFSLANNHMMDFGEEGLRQTKAALTSLGIPFAGAGDNEEDARKPMVLEENGKRIAVFSCCERQFGMATVDSAGCAEKGVWLYNAIREVKKSGQADFVIVSCHAASEYTPWVCPALRDFYHSLIDAGADCIHGHHAHIPQGYEEYNGCPVFYGLGNFVMVEEEAGGDARQLWSQVAVVSFDREIRWSVRPIDLTFRDDSIMPVFSSAKKLLEHNGYLQHANLPFADAHHLVGCWQESSVRMYDRLYCQPLRALPVMGRKLSRHDRARKIWFAMKDLRSILFGRERVSESSLRYGKVLYNYMNCESHYAAISTALGVLTGVEPDVRTAEIKAVANELKIGV